MQIKTGGLQQLPKDDRDFSRTRVLGGFAKIPSLPPSFIVGTPLDIKDQRESDCCTCYASSACIQHTEGIILDPLYLFALAKDMSGDIAAFGLDLRVVCKAACQFGLIEQSISPFTLDKGRDFIATLANWPDLKWAAAKHQQKSFVTVDGAFDTFDNIRLALWNNGKGGNPVLTGAMWEGAWTYAEGAIVSEVDKNDVAGGHAFMFRGWMEIDHVPYLYAQLSNGEEMGDRGFFYFSREVVNSECDFGNFQFIDMPKETAQAIHASPWPAITRFILAIKNLFTRYALS